MTPDTLLDPPRYARLRALAHQHVNPRAAGDTLQPTALLHEAWLRLSGEDGLDWSNGALIAHAVATAMRRIAVERVRARRRLKRGGARSRVPLDEHAVEPADGLPDERVLALEEALRELAQVDPRAHDVVQLRVFAGLDVDETAATLRLSPRTVGREMRAARLWLWQHIREGEQAARRNAS